MAIKVIKQGVKEFHITCPNCGCEFTYELEDLSKTDYLGAIYYVKCPECGITILHLGFDTAIDNMQYNNPCDTCSYYQRLKERLKEAGEIYVGDTPCTWCQGNPFRVTCTNVYMATNTNTNTNVSIDPGKAETEGVTFSNGKN